jgi:hypothetical protein
MASALSLLLSGVNDIVIVDEVEDRKGDLSSRAFVLHAATLEVRSRKAFCTGSLLTACHNRRWILLVALIL